MSAGVSSIKDVLRGCLALQGSADVVWLVRLFRLPPEGVFCHKRKIPMADQAFRARINTFWLDLHHCKYREALEAVKARIDECYQYGITGLEVVHGTPERKFVRTVAMACLEAAGASPRVIHHQLPDISAYQTRVLRNSTFTIRLHPNPTAQPQDSRMVFMPFEASYETREDNRNRFTKEYYPLREWIPVEKLATYLDGQLPNNLENLYESLPKGSLQFNDMGKVELTSDAFYQVLGEVGRSQRDAARDGRAKAIQERSSAEEQRKKKALMRKSPAEISTLEHPDKLFEKWLRRNKEGIHHIRESEYGHAEKSFLAALECLKSDSPGYKFLETLTLINLATSYREQSKYPDSESALVRAMRRATEPTEHLAIALAGADLFCQQARYADALDTLESVSSGAYHLSDKAQQLLNRRKAEIKLLLCGDSTTLLLSLRENEKNLPSFVRINALVAVADRFGRDNPNTAHAAYTEALRLLKLHVGEYDAAVGQLCSRFAEFLLSAGQGEESSRLAQVASDIEMFWKRVQNETGQFNDGIAEVSAESLSETDSLDTNLADIRPHIQKGNFSTARDISRRKIDNLRREDSDQRLSGLLTLARLEFLLGDPSEGIRDCDEVLQILRSNNLDDSQSCAVALRLRAECHFQLGQSQSATADIAESIRRFELLSGMSVSEVQGLQQRELELCLGLPSGFFPPESEAIAIEDRDLMSFLWNLERIAAEAQAVRFDLTSSRTAQSQDGLSSCIDEIIALIEHRPPKSPLLATGYLRHALCRTLPECMLMLAESLTREGQLVEAGYVFEKAISLYNLIPVDSIDTHLVYFDILPYVDVLKRVSPTLDVEEVLMFSTSAICHQNNAVRSRLELAIGEWHLWRGNLQQASTRLKSSFTLHRECFGMEHKWTTAAACRLAACYLLQKDAPRATKLLESLKSGIAQPRTDTNLNAYFFSLLIRAYSASDRTKTADSLLHELGERSDFDIKSSASLLLAECKFFLGKGLREKAVLLLKEATFKQDAVWDTPEDRLWVAKHRAVFAPSNISEQELHSAVWSACLCFATES